MSCYDNYYGYTSCYIQLSKQESSGVPGRTQAYRLVLTVTDTLGIEPELFLYARRTLNPTSGEQADAFISICSPSDIEEFPVGAPDPDADLPFFRLDSVDLLFRNPELMLETYNAILQDFAELARSMDAIAQLGPAATVQFTFNDD
jgi:hypothetical protein